MEISSGRGLHSKETAKINKARVKEFFDSKPNSTRKECCEALGLSYATVRAHIVKIQAEEV